MKLKLFLILILIVILYTLNCSSKNEKDQQSKLQPSWINKKSDIFISDNNKTIFFIGRSSCHENKKEAFKEAKMKAHNSYKNFIKSMINKIVSKSYENIKNDIGNTVDNSITKDLKKLIYKEFINIDKNIPASDIYYQKKIDNSYVCYSYYVRIMVSTYEIKDNFIKTMDKIEKYSSEELLTLIDEIKIIINNSNIDKNLKLKIAKEKVKEKELETIKTKSKINPYTYWITALTPGLNHFYLPYILNPIDEDEYRYGVTTGILTGVGGGGAIVLIGIFADYRSMGGFVAIGGGMIGGVGGVSGIGGIGGVAGGFVSVRYALYINYLYRIYNDGKRIYLGEVFGFASGAFIGYTLGDLYGNPWVGAITAGTVGFFSGVIIDLLSKDEVFPDYNPDLGPDEDNNKYYSSDGKFDLDRYRRSFLNGFIITESLIYLTNLLGYIIVYNYYNPTETISNNDGIAFDGFDLQPIFYREGSYIMIDKGIKGSFNLKF